MHMNCEKKDYLLDSDVVSKKGIRVFGFLKAVFQRKGTRVRDVNDYDAGELIYRHNSIFGIDSADPSASIRKDLRCIPPSSTVVLPETEVMIIENVVAKAAEVFEPIIAEPVTAVIAQPHAVSATSTSESAEVGACSYDSGSIDMGRYVDDAVKTEAPVSEVELFPEVEPKHAPQPAQEEESLIEMIEAEIEADVAELGDVAAEEIAEAAVEQIEGRETVQMTIDNPSFDVPECEVCAEPVIIRQDKLGIEVDTPVIAAEELAEEIVEAVVAAEVVMEKVEAVTEVPVQAEPVVEEVSEPAVEIPSVPLERFVEDVPVEVAPVRPRTSSGVSFRFGAASSQVAGTTGIRFVFGTASD